MTATPMTATPVNEPAHPPDELCVCGHQRHRHAERERDLLDTFDDGRAGSHGYCGCPRFRS
jgi:hypothetical protein